MNKKVDIMHTCKKYNANWCPESYGSVLPLKVFIFVQNVRIFMMPTWKSSIVNHLVSSSLSST